MKETSENLDVVKAKVLYEDIKRLDCIKKEIDSLSTKRNPVFDALSFIVPFVVFLATLAYLDVTQEVYFACFMMFMFIVGNQSNNMAEHKRLHKRIDLIKTLLDYKN